MKKLQFLLVLPLLFLFAVYSFSQASGNIDLGSEITNGIMTDGCVSSCQPMYCTNQSDNSGNHPTETMTITITGIAAGQSAEITLTSVLCGSTSGLDSGDDIYIDGVQVFDGGSNAAVGQVECVAGGADIVIEFLANRRDEIINVSWISGPTAADPVDCIDAILEVEYAHFTASKQNENVILNWATLKEIQNDYFEIEHSLDGRIYNSIAKVLGEGDSEYTVDYHFLHKEAAAGANYYRLKQYDFNGVYRMSKTVTVELKPEIQFSIRPSLVNDRLSISHPGNSDLRIISLQGQIVDIIKVNDYKEYDVSNLVDGIYVISTTVNGQLINKRFVKN